MEKTLQIDTSSPEQSDSIDVVKFVGEFDKAGLSDVRAELETFIKNFSKKFLIFDFSELKFINSEGIGYLMEIHAHLMKNDKKLVIVGSNSHVEDVFKTIGLSEIISLYSSLTEFKNK